MAKHLVRGEKVLIGDVGGHFGNLALQLDYRNNNRGTLDLDLFVFVQDDAGKIEKKNILYYGAPECFSGQLRYEEVDQEPTHSKVVKMNLDALPSNVNRLILGCTVYREVEQEHLGFASPVLEQNLLLTVKDTLRQSELYDFEVKFNPDGTATLLVGEVYKYNGTWKFHANGATDDDVLLGVIKKFFNASFK